MPTYAIGDVQGCFETLTRLMARIDFDPSRDRAWLVGDIVNRGPRSLETLRWARDHEAHVTMVLGNHDLHLIAAAEGRRALRRRDTLDDVLAAPDRDELLTWLRRRPLLVREDRWLLVHAGIPAHWTLPVAEARARDLEHVLREDLPAALDALAEPSPEVDPGPGSTPAARAFAFAALTRMRACRGDGSLVSDFNGPPAELPADALAWFDLPSSLPARHCVVFGHWAALGLHVGEQAVGLDTGCVWGGQLTAVRLEDGEVFQEPLADPVAG